MPTLLELQRAFHADVIAPAVDAADGLATAVGTWPAGMAVYRNNLRENTRKALAADYPVIERLVGASCWRALVQAYVVRHPSTSGDRSDFGRAFPAFLASHYAGGEFDYLADVARLERAIDESLLSELWPAPEISILATMGPVARAGAVLLLQPSVQFVASSFPVVAIWQMNRNPDEPQPLDVANGGDCLLVQRVADEVVVRRLTSGSYCFLTALATGVDLSTAVSAALGAEAEFDVGRALFEVFSWQLVRGVRTPNLDALVQGDPV